MATLTPVLGDSPMERAIKKALERELVPEYVAPGQYQCTGSDGSTVYMQLVSRDVNGELCLFCDCPGGKHHRHEGNSCCYHCGAVLVRLAQCPDEDAAVPQAITAAA